MNPYTAPKLPEDPRTSLSFDGVVQEQDYADLIPRHDFDSSLLLFLLVLLVFASLMFLAGGIFGAWRQGWDPILFSVIGLLAITLTGSLFVTHLRRPIVRARRQLKRYPDIIGVARGMIDESGMHLFDGTRHHWFAPQQLIDSRVSQEGVRIRFDEHAGHFLPLTSKMFDGYSENVAKAILEAWRSTTSLQPAEASFAASPLWQGMNPSSGDAIRFSGSVTLNQSYRTAEVRKQAIAETTSAVVGLALGVYGERLVEKWLCYVALAVGIYALVSSVIIWLRYLFGSHVISWEQSGWFSTEEFAIQSQNMGTKLALHDVCKFDDQGETLILEDSQQTQYRVSRDHVQSNDDWLKIKERCRSGLEMRQEQ